MRIEALNLAVSLGSPGESFHITLARAMAFLEFMTGAPPSKPEPQPGKTAQ